MADEENKDEIRNEDELGEDVIRLKSWLKVQPHLPQNIDEELLIAFVYGTKSLEKAKTKLDGYLKLRGKYRELFDFSYRDPLSAAFQESCQAMKMLILPEATDEGHRVLCTFPHQDIQKFNHQLFDIRWMMLVELAMMKWPKMKGMILMMDSSGFDSSVLKKIDPSSASAAMRLLQETVPVKLKKVIYINAPPFADIVFSMIRPFIKGKLLERVVISSEGPELLKKYLPIDIFPKEYGGKEKSAEELNDYWMNALVENRDWFAKTSLLTSDERKRPPGTNSSKHDEGTFRFLQID